VSVPAPVAAPSEQPLFEGFPWQGVARLLDRAPTIADLRIHRLELLAAARCRELGVPTPRELEGDVLEAQLASLTAGVLVRRLREICDGPLLVFKGLEVAAYYPAPGLRPFGDVDVLVADPDSVQRSLEAAGFWRVGPDLEWETLHHLPRLAPPDLPFCVEIHRRPKWIPDLPAPSFDELLAGAVPSASGVADVLAPAPATHAVLLAAHAWAERPLGCIADLVDVVAVAKSAGENEAETRARELGVQKAWSATRAASRAILEGEQPAWPQRTWARHLPQVRGQTVLESHLERVLAPFAALPLLPALKAGARGAWGTLRRADGETWRRKLARTRRALKNAFVRRSEHERDLDRDKRR
jgi:hypothetical protein